MRLERRDQPLLPRRAFYARMALFGLLAALVIALSLLLGMIGYHSIAGLNWIDALLNASMILTGMGPVDHLAGDGAKFFASIYAIFSGVVFLTMMGLLMAPIFHRILHKFHLPDDEPEEKDNVAEKKPRGRKRKT